MHVPFFFYFWLDEDYFNYEFWLVWHEWRACYDDWYYLFDANTVEMWALCDLL